ncbi:MAG: PAS domain S-box protein [Gammaproteobacteria bacterium]|nr:PAS domain S-box protein [Gammaproteobacteria bacterium]
MISKIKNFWTVSVARQLILGIALIHALLMSIFVFDLVGRQREFMIEQNTSQAKGLAEALAANGTSWILANDIIGLEEVILSQSRFPGLDYAMFLDMNGKVLGYTDREKVGLYVKDSVSQKLLSSSAKIMYLIKNPSFIDVAAPVMIKEQQIGWARVGVNRYEIVHSLDVVTSNGLTYTLIAISAGVFFAWFMARGLTSSIRELTNALQQVIKGKRDIKCEINRQDEIGILSQNFNLMLVSIKEQEEKVKQTHEALLESEVKFHRLVDAMSREYFLYAYDTNGVFTYTTQSIASVLGYTVDEFKINYNDFYTSNPVNEKAKIHIEKSIKGELQPSYELEIYHKNGDNIWLNVSEVPVFDEQGKVISVEGIAHDISQRKYFETILLAKEKEQREILDTMLDGVITIDENGLVITCNPAAEKIFGYQFSELRGKSFALLFSASSLFSLTPDEVPDEEKDVFDLIGIRRQEQDEIFVDVNGEHKDGSVFPVRLSLANLSVGENGKKRYICSCFDLTEQKYQEEQLRRSQKMDALGKLTGGIAHDFNNMLGVILGYSDLMLMKAKEQPKLVKYINEIRYAGERGKKLTQKLLAFSRRKEMESERVDINELLTDNYHMLTKSLTSKIELKYNLSDGIWPVWFDKGDMEDALVNLSINALHAMPDGGTLTINTENVTMSPEQAQLRNIKPGDFVHLSMTDTGIGMDKKIIDQIFDPFFTTKDDIGTGLGLSQVYGFIQHAGGGINVYSELGYGSCFSMFFPRFQLENSDQAHDSKTKPVTAIYDTLHGSGEIILLVDDEPSLLSLGEEILTLNGYRVFKAESAAAALKILEFNEKESGKDSDKISMLISDVIMPEIDGYQLAKTVTNLYPDIKIQLSSGFNDDRHLKYLDDSLHNTILSKPYTSDELLKKVADVLQKN